MRQVVIPLVLLLTISFATNASTSGPTVASADGRSARSGYLPSDNGGQPSKPIASDSTALQTSSSAKNTIATSASPVSIGTTGATASTTNIGTSENSKVSPFLKFKIKLANKPAASLATETTPASVPNKKLDESKPTAPPVVNNFKTPEIYPQVKVYEPSTKPALQQPKQQHPLVGSDAQPQFNIRIAQTFQTKMPDAPKILQSEITQKIPENKPDRTPQSSSSMIQTTQRAPESKAPETSKLSVGPTNTKPTPVSSQEANSSPSNQPPPAQTPTPTVLPTNQLPPNPRQPVQDIPEKLPPGVFSHTKRTMVDLIPADARVYSETSFSQKGNLKTINLRKFYIDNSNQKSYISEETIVEKIDPTIPESNQLEPSKKNVEPFNGFIADVKTFSNWDGLCSAIFQELNLARTQPKQYAGFIQQQLDNFTDEFSFSYGPFTTASVEGKNAWREAIKFLNQQEPKQALRRIDCLDKGADWFAKDAANSLILGHIDSKGRAPSDRMKESCVIGSGGQNIAYGMMSARAAIMQLIVDDDVPDRGHRINIYKSYTQVGLACGQYPEYGTITVNDFLY